MLFSRWQFRSPWSRPAHRAAPGPPSKPYPPHRATQANSPRHTSDTQTSCRLSEQPYEPRTHNANRPLAFVWNGSGRDPETLDATTQLDATGTQRTRLGHNRRNQNAHNATDTTRRNQRYDTTDRRDANNADLKPPNRLDQAAKNTAADRRDITVTSRQQKVATLSDQRQFD